MLVMADANTSSCSLSSSLEMLSVSSASCVSVLSVMRMSFAGANTVAFAVISVSGSGVVGRIRRTVRMCALSSEETQNETLHPQDEGE